MLGVCLPYGTNKCVSLTGASLTTPVNFHSAIPANNIDNGPALTLGTSVYVPNSGGSDVTCYNYATNTGCAGYPKKFTAGSLSGLYTVNADPQRPGCLWVDSDSGTDEIQNFEATGGVCAHGPLRVRADALVAQDQSCQPASYTSLQVTSPPRSTYTSASVSIEDNQGNPISGLPSTPLDSLGTADLSGVGIVAKIPLPQFDITFTGLSPGRPTSASNSPGRPPTAPTASPVANRRLPTSATRWWRPTAASSPTGRPASTARPGTST